MKKLVLLTFICLLAGCNFSSKDQFNMAPPPANPPPGGNGNGDQLQQQDLRGKSFSEVMTVKYDRAEIVCSLWTMLAGDLDLERAPSSQFRIDLKQPFAFPIQFNLRGGIRGFGKDFFREVHSVDTVITIYKAVIRESFGVHVPEIQTRYNFMYSPEIGFNANTTVRSWFQGEELVERYRKPQAQIHEKLPTDIVNLVSDVIPNEFGFQTYDYVKCVVETAIKPAYQHQFATETLPQADGAEVARP